MLTIQHIEIVYTKRSRGGPGAIARAALPRAFCLSTWGRDAFLLERYYLHERGGFEVMAPIIERCEAVPNEVGDLRIEQEDDCYVIGFLSTDRTGAPWRHPKPRALTLAPGQVGKVIVNGRHVYEDAWYTEVTYNLAVGYPVDADAFLRESKVHTVDLRATLL